MIAVSKVFGCKVLWYNKRYFSAVRHFLSAAVVENGELFYGMLSIQIKLTEQFERKKESHLVQQSITVQSHFCFSICWHQFFCSLFKCGWFHVGMARLCVLLSLSLSVANDFSLWDDREIRWIGPHRWMTWRTKFRYNWSLILAVDIHSCHGICVGFRSKTDALPASCYSKLD